MILRRPPDFLGAAVWGCTASEGGVRDVGSSGFSRDFWFLEGLPIAVSGWRTTPEAGSRVMSPGNE